MPGGHGRLSGGSHRRRVGRLRGVSRRRGLARGEIIRAQVLREFRGSEEPLDLEENMSTPADLLGGILKDLRLTEGVEESRLREAWSEVAGEFVGRQTEPVSLRHGVLTLRVIQPSMRFHLEQIRNELLHRLKQKLGAQTVRDVRLILG